MYSLQPTHVQRFTETSGFIEKRPTPQYRVDEIFVGAFNWAGSQETWDGEGEDGQQHRRVHLEMKDGEPKRK
jgi:hypothetical protein